MKNLERAWILVVEDEDDIRDVIACRLQSAGAHVATAGNGEEALEAVSQNRYDLVLTDLRMPKMGGLDLIVALRRAEPQTPIVVVTGYGNYETFIDVMNLGAKAYVPKPFSMNQIAEVVSAALSREQRPVS